MRQLSFVGQLSDFLGKHRPECWSFAAASEINLVLRPCDRGKAHIRRQGVLDRVEMRASEGADARLRFPRGAENHPRSRFRPTGPRYRPLATHAGTKEGAKRPTVVERNGANQTKIKQR
jgi:hypothetical protein